MGRNPFVQLERMILAELRRVKGDQKIKMSQIMEWALGDKLRGDAGPQEGEEMIHLSTPNEPFGVQVAWKPELKKKSASS